ncbi:hypothetical protein [Legionella londiniensis]|uniref:hypothetical protein n=1 Tax=Legionella londiniensis TaxID=45068 RepID=UPI0012ED6D1C|nr:hypothetical protein [Legionella londiniensis]
MNEYDSTTSFARNGAFLPKNTAESRIKKSNCPTHSDFVLQTKNLAKFCLLYDEIAQN